MSGPSVPGDKVWFEDVPVLARRWTEFFPRVEHTPEERVNALVRLIVYATLAAFAYNRETRTLVLGAGAAAVVSLAFGTTRETGPRQHLASGATGASGAGAPLFPPGSKECTPPTRENPFANVLLTDLSKPLRPPACHPDAVKAEQRDLFNAGLIRNATDIYERENSQHQFYTMPVTTGIPDTGAFANFLYGGMKSCKEDASACPSRIF